jgi:hypothetical protein
MKNLIVITLLLGATMCANAQSDFQNTGILFISGSSDIVFINAAMTNASTGALTNNGSLYVSQTLTNNQTSMAVGTGTLYLNGSTSQSIAGGQPFKTYNLVTNNASGIVLNNNLDVTAAHTFVNGIISSSATPNYLIYQSGASYSGDDDSKHVSGWIKRFGSTNFAFPVGNGLVERPVTLTNISATSEFNVKHNMTTPNTSSLQSPIVHVDGSEYWTINRVSGGTAQIFMNWNNPKVSFPTYNVPDIRAVYYNGTVWTNQGGSATGTVTTTGTITSNAMSTFGNFTFGSISAVLPVNFLNIRGQKELSYNLIHWSTAEESRIDHFEVLRSSDGINFSKIGTQLAFNTTGVHHYQFKDMQPLSSSSWYRVRNIDIDGRYSYSSIIKLDNASAEESIQVLQNPVQDKIQLSFVNVENGQYLYQLFNIAGGMLQNGTLNVSTNYTGSIGLKQNVTQGVYVLKISNSRMHYSTRIIVR